MPLPSDGNLPSSEFGLALGFVIGHHFLDMQDLHYGYWPEGLPWVPQNLAQAQANYTDFLMSHIPAGVKSVLDVGCGAGNTARKLLERGFTADCVSPNGVLTSVAKQVLHGRGDIFETRFQDLATTRRYDLILFSESLLFIPLEEAFTKALSLLTAGGYVLSTDIFRVPIARFPLVPTLDLDMTDGIAPTFDMLDAAYREAIQPAYKLIISRLEAKYPWVMKLVKWKFKNKMQRYEDKHFSGRRNGLHFKKYKSYRLMLYRTAPPD